MSTTTAGDRSAAGGLRLGADGVLRNRAGQRFEAAGRQWLDDNGPHTGAEAPRDRSARDLSAHEAVRWLQTESGHPLRTPIGVIGPRDVNDEQMAAAREVGAGLARMGLAVVCGGRHGIMQAAAEGVRAEGGVSIGMLPDPTPELANPFLTWVIATGLGEARNAIIARSAHLLIAIGDSYGTLSEVALGRQFGKTVFGLLGAARVDGVEHRQTAAEVLDRVAEIVIGGG